MRPLRTALSLTAAAALAGVALVPGSAGADQHPTNDPYVAAQFGLTQVTAPQAWAAGATGAGAVVAVVDSGVDLGHEDLQGQLVPGATFTGCDGGRAPCGNGDHKGPDGENDGDEHGTHVAGIVAAAADNATGIAGVARDAKVMPVKVLEEGSGSFEEIAAGIRWSVDHGADVVNLSLGALPGAQALTLTGLVTDAAEAVAYARSKDVLVVAAAGNDFQFPLCGTPAFEAGALCVTSTDKREAPSAFSNNGLKPDLLAVAGPGGSLLPVCGEDVVSTVPAGTGRSTACGYTDSYDEYAGTSMATPHVAGVAALLAGQGKDDDQILAALLSTSRQGVTGQRGVFTPQYGYGIVDAAAAVGAPSAPAEGEPAPEPTTEPTKEPKPRPTRPNA